MPIINLRADCPAYAFVFFCTSCKTDPTQLPAVSRSLSFLTSRERKSPALHSQRKGIFCQKLAATSTAACFTLSAERTFCQALSAMPATTCFALSAEGSFCHALLAAPAATCFALSAEGAACQALSMVEGVSRSTLVTRVPRRLCKG